MMSKSFSDVTVSTPDFIFGLSLPFQADSDVFRPDNVLHHSFLIRCTKPSFSIAPFRIRWELFSKRFEYLIYFLIPQLSEKPQLEEYRIQYTEDRRGKEPDVNNLTMSEI